MVLLLVLEQAEQAVPLVQLAQVYEQATQAGEPTSKYPASQGQFGTGIDLLELAGHAVQTVERSVTVQAEH